MKDYREVQVSTTILVFIILGILILGTVIFFMGVQVGKKQSDLLAQSLVYPKTEEKVSQDTPVIPAEQTTATAPEKTQALSQPEVVSQPVSSATQAGTTPQHVASETRSVTSTEKPVSPATSSQEKATSPSTVKGSGDYFVQVGAFNDLSSARLAAERFKKQGYGIVIKDPYPSDRKPVYRVWLGGYPTREEASRVMDELANKSVKNPGYFIVHQ